MFSLNAASPVSHRATSPAFAGNDQKIPTIVVGQHAPINKEHQDEWRKQLEVRRNQEASTQSLLREWNEFKTRRLSGYSAPAVKDAVKQLTQAIQGQVELAARYTNGKFESGLEKGYAEAPKDPNAPKFIRLLA